MNKDEFFEKYNNKLTPQQMAAVGSVEGATLLLAVPGSGKTTVLVHRLGYMIYVAGVAPEKILTVTYTVAATRDMAERFGSVFGQELAERMEFRTINGICAKILMRYGQLTGKTPFELLRDEKMISGMIGRIFQEVEGSFATESDIKGIRSLIAYCKNMMLNEEEIDKLKGEAGFDILTIYRKYCEELKKQKRIDYDDQMVYAYKLLCMSPEILGYFQDLYPYICVDEAQDTSKIQHSIIDLLAKKTGNLFMVGDEDQSIYGFRAAYPEALLYFEKNHPGARVLVMEENFRSNAKIVEAADRFIQKNTLRHEKHMISARNAGSDIDRIDIKSRRAQYNYLLKVAADCRKQTAVLFRNNESVLPLVDLLERREIPYRIRNAELSFFTHRVVLDIENIMRFAYEPDNAEIFLQIYYKLSTYLSKVNAVQICESSKRSGRTILEEAIQCGNLPSQTVKNLKSLRTHFENMLEDTGEKAVSRIVQFMGYGEYLERADMDNSKIPILKAIAGRENSPSRFLSRMEELQEILQNKVFDPGCRFILSTIHSSKGLEYEAVYMIDVEDGIFPDVVPANPKTAPKAEKEHYEEERRLFYVGVTRAKEDLHIFRIEHSKTSFVNELFYREPVVKNRGKITAGQAFSTEEYRKYQESLNPGDEVQHKVYGKGIIREKSPDKLIVEFGNGVKRTMALEVLYRNGLLWKI